jgi:hypothetical protein
VGPASPPQDRGVVFVAGRLAGRGCTSRHCSARVSGVNGHFVRFHPASGLCSAFPAQPAGQIGLEHSGTPFGRPDPRRTSRVQTALARAEVGPRHWGRARACSNLFWLAHARPRQCCQMEASPAVRKLKYRHRCFRLSTTDGPGGPPQVEMRMPGGRAAVGQLREPEPGRGIDRGRLPCGGLDQRLDFNQYLAANNAIGCRRTRSSEYSIWFARPSGACARDRGLLSRSRGTCQPARSTTRLSRAP